MSQSVPAALLLQTVASLFPVVSVVGTSYTLTGADVGKWIRTASADPVTITIGPDPAADFAAWSMLYVEKGGLGDVTLVAGAGVTIESATGLVLTQQFSRFELKRTAVNVWSVSLVGDVVQGAEYFVDLLDVPAAYTGAAGQYLRVKGAEDGVEFVALTPAAIGAQPVDDDLTAIAGLAGTGLIARTGAGTAATRTIQGTANQVTVADGGGVAADPVVSLPAGMRYIGADAVDFLIAETAIASAATVDLGAANTLRVEVTGVVAVSSFGTAANRLRLVRFSSALTLTHNAVSLILPGGLDIAVVAGDTLIATSDASGNWRVRQYTRGAGVPGSLYLGGQGAVAAATVDLGAFPSTSWAISGATPITSFGAPNTALFRLVRFTGGATLVNSANMILLGGADIVTAANDVAIFTGATSGIWRMQSYFRAAKAPDFVALAGDTMTGSLRVPAGTTGVPSLQFASSSNGFARPASDDLETIVAGIIVQHWKSARDLRGVTAAETINSATPAFQQWGTSTGAGSFLVGNASASATGARLYLAHGRGTITAGVLSYGASQAADSVGGVYFCPDTGAVYVTTAAAQIHGRVTGDYSVAGTRNMDLEFWSVAAGTSSIGLKVKASNDLTDGSDNIWLDAARHFRLRQYTVATLPAAGTVGRLAAVSDAAAPAFNTAVVGGGAVKIPVYDNGTAWVAV